MIRYLHLSDMALYPRRIGHLDGSVLIHVCGFFAKGIGDLELNEFALDQSGVHRRYLSIVVDVTEDIAWSGCRLKADNIIVYVADRVFGCRQIIDRICCIGRYFISLFYQHDKNSQYINIEKEWQRKAFVSYVADRMNDSKDSLSNVLVDRIIDVQKRNITLDIGSVEGSDFAVAVDSCPVVLHGYGGVTVFFAAYAFL